MPQCPYCQQPLPPTPERFCPNCGGDLQAGASAPSGALGSPRGTPWERRAELGLGTALVETTKEVLTAPTAFYRAMPVGGGIGTPLGFGVIVGYIGLAVSAIYNAIFHMMVGSAFSSFGRHSELQPLLTMMQGGAGLVINLVLGPVFIVIGLFLASGILHVMLMLLGGANRDFEATFRVASFAQASSLLSIIPFCGGLIGAVYGLVLFVIGLSEAHRISRGKAATAVLIPLVVFCCCCVVIPLVVMFGGVAALMRHPR